MICLPRSFNGLTALTASLWLLSPMAAQLAHAQEDSTVADALARVPVVAPTVLSHADAMARVTGAMATCILAVSDPSAATALLQGAGWLAQPAEAGEAVFADTAEAATFVTLLDSGGECAVSTTVSGTADVMKNFFDTTLALDWPAFDWADDSGQGCLSATMDASLAVSITGADGTCPTGSAAATITFTAPQ